MREQEKFLQFSDLQKSFDAIVAEEDAKKQSRQKVSEEEQPAEEEREIIAGDVVADPVEEAEETQE